jgi:hypothetical protein
VFSVRGDQRQHNEDCRFVRREVSRVLELAVTAEKLVGDPSEQLVETWEDSWEFRCGVLSSKQQSDHGS